MLKKILYLIKKLFSDLTTKKKGNTIKETEEHVLSIVIERKKTSYNFKHDSKKPNGFDNNWEHNMEDSLVLFDDKAEILRIPVQTVSNYNFGDYKSYSTVETGDTIAEGNFKLKCFVEKRKFHGEIHGITETKDIDGEWISHDSMETTINGYQNGRFLVHDNWSEKNQGPTNYAWSAGCWITTPANLECLNSMLHAYNVQPGDIISGEVVEV